VAAVSLGKWIRFGVWLVSGYAHVFILISVVIVTLPVNSGFWYLCHLLLSYLLTYPSWSVNV